MTGLSRRHALLAISGGILAAPFMGRDALAQSADVSKEMILNDPAAPVAGNPKRDVTIVAFLDYNCPYCKKSAPDLDRAVKEDGKVRLVYRSVRTRNVAARSHSTLLKIAKVCRPTSRATGRVRLAARNFAGVARKETPMSNPIQSKASVNTEKEDLLVFRGFAIESTNFA